MRDEFNDHGPVDLGNECRRDYQSRPWHVPMTDREKARERWYEELRDHDGECDGGGEE